MPRDRYEARSGDRPGQWLVWDRWIDSVVFGCESMRAAEAIEYARWLSEIYRQLHPDKPGDPLPD
jgi:hypothetical protein